MAKIYDIASKITNELPTVKITDDLICTVNNRRSAVLSVQAMVRENKDSDEIEIMDKALKLLIGAKKAEEINKMDLPYPEYAIIFNTVMAAAQGKDPEELEKTP